VSRRSYKMGLIYFLAGWYKRQDQPGFRFITFSFMLVFTTGR